MAPQSRMVTLDSDMFKCCHKLSTLGWSQDAYARSLLQRATDQVRPIMAKRRWAVPLVAEFYPPATNLLGMNRGHGSKIELRLRSPRDRDAFLSYETILGTLLHELAHIDVGPHNAQFYKLLDELNAECDALIAQGNDGTGDRAFGGRGQRIGEGLRGNVPRHVARERAVRAAQQRARVGRLMQGGGQRLGGRAEVARSCDPRMMALAAAKRRLADEVWCGALVEDSAVEVVDVDAAENNEGEVINVDEDEVQIVEAEVRKPPQRRLPPRVQARIVPIRQNPVALAALQRAAQPPERGCADPG